MRKIKNSYEELIIFSCLKNLLFNFSSKGNFQAFHSCKVNSIILFEKKGLKRILLVLIIAFGFMMNAIGQKVESWEASPETVERLSKKDPNVNYYEEKVPDYTLPPLLVTEDGEKVTRSNEWYKVRRPEILELFSENVYGQVSDTPYEQTFKVVNEDRNAMEGEATLKEVVITITSGEKSLLIHLNLFVPNKAKIPVPLFLLINNRGPDVVDPSRNTRSEFWPAEEVVARGYGIAVFNNSDLDPDNYDNFKNGIHGVLDRGERKGDSWGTLAAWAWGASRSMDYFETDPLIDHKKIALLGHSRGGKAALWAGVQDERFAMVLSNESGAGGAALARRRFGETVTVMNNSSIFYWFCSNYKKYSNNEDALPVDQHMLLALIAPRALYLACADEDLWGDPKGSYLSLYHALPVYQLLKTHSTLPETMPSLNTPTVSGKVGYHIREGTHNMLVKDWNWFMDFADKIFK